MQLIEQHVKYDRWLKNCILVIKHSFNPKINIKLISFFHCWILSADLPEHSLFSTAYSSTPSFTFFNTMLVGLSFVHAVICIDCHLLPLACRVVPTIQSAPGLFLNQIKAKFSARTEKYQHVKDTHEPPTLMHEGQ